MASIYDLQGDRERALAARRVAAEAFAANELPGEAAAERLVIAGYLQSRRAARRGERHRGQPRARRRSAPSARTCRRASMGLEGVARVKGGAFDEGMATIREGLSLALERELTPVAAEVYQRLGHRAARSPATTPARATRSAWRSACATRPATGLQHTCLSCMAYVLRELGEWDEADELCARADRARRAAPGHARRRRRARRDRGLARARRRAAGRC